MIFGKFSRPFGRAMQIPEESGMQVRVKNGDDSARKTVEIQGFPMIN